MRKKTAESEVSLHQLAENKARFDEAAMLKTMTLGDSKQLFHELRVYQIELEMQNEELRSTQQDLEASQMRYFSLYNMAPIGYMTIDDHELIQDANLAAATMLGKNRKELHKKPFSRFIFSDDQDIYYHRIKEIMAGDDLVDWEMRLKRSDGVVLWVHLHATPYQNGESWITLTDISSRKMAEENLRKSEDFYHKILQTTVEGFWIVDMNGKFIDANEAYCKMIGYNHTELLEMRISDLEAVENEVGIADRMAEVIMHGTLRFESRHRCKDGHILDLEISVNYLPTEKQMFTFLRDISDKKWTDRVMEARLRISNFAFAHPLNEVLTIVLDESEALTESEIGFLHFVEADQQTLQLQTWSTNTLSSICTAESTQQHYALNKAGVWADCIRERKSLIHNDYESMPNRKGLPSGHAPVHRELVVPIFRHNLIVAVIGLGNKKTDYTLREMTTIEHLSNLAWDIIKRKRVEESLKTTELEYSRLFESMTDGYVRVAMDGRIIESNEVYQRITGYSGAELESLTYIQLTPEKWQTIEADILAQQVMVRGHSEVYEKEYIKKDGTIINVEMKTYLLKDDTGKAYGMWAIVRDISERKKVEVALQLAKEDAEAANRAKSDFLATMSHEIRTPLSAMLGNVELLEGSQLSGQQHEYLRDCKSASQMLLQVINDVLDYSKIESGKLELISETFSIKSLSIQLVRIFTATAKQKGLSLIMLPTENLPEYIYCDQQRLRQIISNLLNNAIKFTQHGTVSLEVKRIPELSPEFSDKALIQIVVSDTGIGIPADKYESIFESFTQIGNFTTRSVSGTGLGLPICRRLLGLMGGTINVSSLPGEGSVFTVILPVTACNAPENVQVQAHTMTQGHPWNILLADDDDRGREVTQKLLQRRGYKVTAVENGTEILAALQKDNYDILLTDISMPDMDGTAVAQIIRSGEKVGINVKIPIIAMTAHAFDQDRARFLAAGINGYVSKPVKLENLFRQIDDLCGAG